MRNFGKVLGHLLLFSVVILVFAPSIDLIACCNDYSTAIPEHGSPVHLCSFCLHAAGLVSYQIFDIRVTPIPVDIDEPVIAFSGPTFSIDKPPQN